MAEEKKSVAIIGSLNIDFVTRTARVPAAGETLAAKSFETGFGGKGANQAVAAARLAGESVNVRMVGSVGDDSFGADYIKALRKEGIDVGGVRQLKGAKTGITNIVVEEATGENRIMFVENANGQYGATYEPSWDLVGPEDDVLVFQLELPLRVVLHNMQQAREIGKHIVFNPAPAVELPAPAYRNIDTLIMNETEAEILVGRAHPGSVESQTHSRLITLAQDFLSKGVRDAVIVTLGGKGLVYATALGSTGHVAAYPAQVVDTTAAGDTFVGGYAVRRAADLSLNFDHTRALSFASLAASKTVERNGAMAAIPQLSEVQ